MKPLLLLISIVCLSACSFLGDRKAFPVGNYQVICGYTDEVYLRTREEKPQDAEPDTYCDNPYYHRSFLALRDQEKFVLAIDDILLHGTYRFEDGRIELEDPEKGSLSLEIIQVKQDFVQLKGVFSSFNSAHVPNTEPLYINLVLDKTPLRETPSKFDHEVNVWRNIPIRAETEREVKSRVLNFLDYSIAYFQHISNAGIHRDYKMDAIESPIIYAENGIFLKEWDDVPNAWKELFYNKENAAVAYKYLLDGFKGGQKEKYHVTGLLLITFHLKNLRTSLAAQE